ncbi:MAG: hypothetical protein LC772_04295 [Chloroflexi bacterium]|nr:hypothetical protein [Chloroflexota bacterium]
MSERQVPLRGFSDAREAKAAAIRVLQRIMLEMASFLRDGRSLSVAKNTGNHLRFCFASEYEA